MGTFTIDLLSGEQYLFNGNFAGSGGTAANLQQVTAIGASTNIKSTFSNGLVTNKINPISDTKTAIQINKANGVTNVINVDTISGFTGYGTITPKNQIHLFGTDISNPSEFDVQANGITLDGVSGADKNIIWANNGVPKWQAQTFRNENDVFWYLTNTQSQNNPITVMETGRIGINKQSNYVNYHAAEIVSVTGLDDLIISGIYTQNYNTVYEIEIVASGVTFDTWHWKKSIDAGVTYGNYSPSSGATLTPVELEYGISVNFEHLTGHGAGATWRFAGFSQIPQATLSLAPMGIQEVQKTNNYLASPIVYKDITALANGGVYGNEFEIFSVGTGGTIQAIYLGFSVQAHMVYYSINTAGDGITLITQYWDVSIGEWKSLDNDIHKYIDGTENFTKSGRIIWQPNTLTGWNKGYIPNLLETGYELYWIRMITTTNPTIAPTAKSVSVGNDRRFSVYDSFNDYRPSFYIDSKGGVNVGGGNITGSNKLQVNTGNNVQVTPSGTDSLVEFDSENSSVVDLKIKLSSNDAVSPGVTFVKTRGTLDASTCTQTNDLLGSIKFRGRVGTSGRLLAEIGSQYVGTGTTRCGDIYFNTAGGLDPIERMRINYMGNTGFGVTPTATITIKSGTTTNAPLKFNSGNLLNFPQAGAVEFLTDAYYGTISTGCVRKTFAFLENPIFTGNPELPVNTTLNNVNLNNYIYNSGGTNNSYKYNTCDFNKYTGNTQPIINAAITGATNGISIFNNHNICLGGTLVSPLIINGNENICLQGKKITFSSSDVTQIYDKNGCGIELYSSGGTTTIKGMTANGIDSVRLQINEAQATFVDDRILAKGIEYNADYGSTFGARSLVDKNYVDTHAGGIFPKTAVDVATDIPITLSGLTTIDGIGLTNGMRVLVKNQASSADNGVYVATNTMWQRAVDFDQTSEVVNGSYFLVLTGNTSKNNSWILNTPNPITVGVDSLTFVKFTSASGVVGGNGINVTQTGGNYSVSTKLANNCGLTSDPSGLYINTNIAGVGLNYSAGILNVCGSNLQGNSLLWSGNTFNVNPATGTLNNVLNTKLDSSIYQTYTGTTETAINNRTLNTIFNNYTGTTAPNTYSTINKFNNYTGTTAPNTYVTKLVYNVYTGNTKTIVDGKAFLSGATFGGVLKSPKANQNDNSTCVATTSWYISQGGTANPLMNNDSAACGISNLFSRQDHVHPHDTSRLTVNIFSGYTGTTAPATYVTKSTFTTYTGTTVPNTYATKASPTFTGIVTIPTPFTLGAVSVVATGTVMNYLTGATSNIQSQINGKQATITGGATTITTSNLTINRALISDGSGKVAVGNVTSTELNYLTGATSNIQAQINTKTDKTKTIVTLTGNTALNATYADKLIEANGTFTITLPDGMATGMRLDVINIGAGIITLAASTTLNTKGGAKRLIAQWVGASAYHRGSNVWVAVGDLTI